MSLSLSSSFEQHLVHFGQQLRLEMDGSLNFSHGLNKQIANAVLQSSDFYIENPEASTCWKESWMCQAQAFYYFPLNYLRAKGALSRLPQEGFFQGLTHLYDYGAGLGAAALALKETHSWSTVTLIEQSEVARKMLMGMECFSRDQILTEKELSRKIAPNSLLSFSYSLTEQSKLPSWAKEAEALMILEPSTQEDGRKLLEIRQQLIEAGYFIWAPCLHQHQCPLLKDSKRDWCHDRYHFQQPTWFQNIERFLPMKNQTLTTSFLLARKTPPPQPTQPRARIIGDLLKEKGKNRQMICRGDKREFLAWLHKTGLEQEIPRGVLVELSPEHPAVSNEVRVTQILQILPSHNSNS